MNHFLPSAALASLCLAAPVVADQPVTAQLTGPDALAVALTPEMLATLPVQEVDTTHGGSNCEVKGRYAGVLLWDVIAAQTALDDDVKTALRYVVLVTNVVRAMSRMWSRCRFGDRWRRAVRRVSF